MISLSLLALAAAAVPAAQPVAFPGAEGAGRHAVGHSRRRGSARTATMSGFAAPKTAATPPGRRAAARKRRGKKAPMLSAPSTNAFHHHAPRGHFLPCLPAGRGSGIPVRSLGRGSEPG